MITISILSIAAVMALAFANGANDVSKGIATLAGSGHTTYRRALVWGTVWTAAGASLAVVISVRLVTVFTSSLVGADVLDSLLFPLAVALGASVWVLFASATGLPVSTTHALTGAIVGAALGSGGLDAVRWGLLLSGIAAPLALSPLVSGALGYSLHGVAGRIAGACVCADDQVALSAVRSDGTVVARPAPPIITSGVDCPPASGRARMTAGPATHWGAAAAISFARGVNDSPKIAALGTLAFSSLGAGVAGALYPELVQRFTGDKPVNLTPSTTDCLKDSRVGCSSSREKDGRVCLDRGLLVGSKSGGLTVTTYSKALSGTAFVVLFLFFQGVSTAQSVAESALLIYRPQSAPLTYELRVTTHSVLEVAVPSGVPVTADHEDILTLRKEVTSADEGLLDVALTVEAIKPLPEGRAPPADNYQRGEIVGNSQHLVLSVLGEVREATSLPHFSSPLYYRGALDSVALDMHRVLLTPYPQFPLRLLEVGDTWSVQDKVTVNSADTGHLRVNLDTAIDRKMTFTLAGFEERKGYRTAHITFEAEYGFDASSFAASEEFFSRGTSDDTGEFYFAAGGGHGRGGLHHEQARRNQGARWRAGTVAVECRDAPVYQSARRCHDGAVEVVHGQDGLVSAGEVTGTGSREDNEHEAVEVAIPGGAVRAARDAVFSVGFRGSI